MSIIGGSLSRRLKNIAKGMQLPLKQINALIKIPSVSLNGKNYEVYRNFPLC